MRFKQRFKQINWQYATFSAIFVGGFMMFFFHHDTQFCICFGAGSGIGCVLADFFGIGPFRKK